MVVDCLRSRAPKMRILVVLFLSFFPLTSAEVFTALVDMEQLVRTEMQILRYIKTYIDLEETRLNLLKSHVAESEDMLEEASSDVTKYLANPINAYLLVKRLTTDLSQIETVMQENSYPEYFRNLTQLRAVSKFPSMEDLNGAAVALMRLQDTYKLDTHSLADGILMQKKYSRNLTAGDCFELGRQSYNNQDYYHTVLWMREALKKESKEKKKTASRQEILEYLEFSTFKQGNIREALLLAKQVLKLSPEHQRIKTNIDNYEEMIREQENVKKHGETGSLDSKFTIVPPEIEIPQADKPRSQYTERDVYEALCRGEETVDPQIAKKLACHYTSNGIAYYRLRPIKVEVAYDNPRIYVFHDVIYDSEIATIKKLATPRFKRAVVRNAATGTYTPAHYRISKAAWLDNEEHRHIHQVSRRVGVISGLDIEESEQLQVVNYGIGGHYEPHFDFAPKGDGYTAPAGYNWGNRIATWIFYMSDVEAGGATAFPELNLTLWPRKGSAGFWYNLLPSGEGDERTRHAACPVLIGSKWVSNKWIHEVGQELRRPCRLTADAEV